MLGFFLLLKKNRSTPLETMPVQTRSQTRNEMTNQAINQSQIRNQMTNQIGGKPNSNATQHSCRSSCKDSTKIKKPTPKKTINVVHKKPKAKKRTPVGAPEFIGWKQFDRYVSLFQNIKLFISGEHWGCEPCKRKKPSFLKQPGNKIIVHIARDVPNEWQHFGLQWNVVPCIIEKQGNGFLLTHA
jgi:hypothetical protein